MKSLIIFCMWVVLLVGCAQTTAPTPTPVESVATDSAYVVDINPADFVETIDNPYFFLTPGAKYIYEGQTEDGLERIEVEITAETREVMGVTVTIVHDAVYLEGELVEDTFDWYAQDKEGNVWYFGEDSKEIEDGQVVSTKGSWEAGVDGALPGIIMYADPAAHIGEPYRQEYYKGEAEDMAEVLNVTESASVAYGSFDNLLLTKEWNLLEPGLVEHKYHAPGVGLVLEKKVEGGSDQIELVEIQPN